MSVVEGERVVTESGKVRGEGLDVGGLKAPEAVDDGNYGG